MHCKVGECLKTSMIKGLIVSIMRRIRIVAIVLLIVG